MENTHIFGDLLALHSHRWRVVPYWLWRFCATSERPRRSKTKSDVASISHGWLRWYSVFFCSTNLMIIQISPSEIMNVGSFLIFDGFCQDHSESKIWNLVLEKYWWYWCTTHHDISEEPNSHHLGSKCETQEREILVICIQLSSTTSSLNSQFVCIQFWPQKKPHYAPLTTGIGKCSILGLLDITL